jgi:hypothetical protein
MENLGAVWGGQPVFTTRSSAFVVSTWVDKGMRCQAL